MCVKAIIRIDDISDKYEFSELKDWFLSNFPMIPVSFYLEDSHYTYKWGTEVWNDIKNMVQNYRWEIGGHSRNHYHLPRLPDIKLYEEVAKNINDIEKSLKLVGINYKVTSFAYPFGEFDDRVKNILKKSGIIHGLTYSKLKNYKTQLYIPENNLFEIGISCNANNDINDWNRRFTHVFEKNGTYILCLHTSHWSRPKNWNNFKRILKSKSIKEFNFSIRRFLKYFFEKDTNYRWDMLKEHLNFMLNHPNVEFITFKELIQ